METKIREDVFGWFDSPLSETPDHDPGMDGICPVCGNKLSVPVKTISIAPVNGNRSYFYRTHKECYDGLSDTEIMHLDSSLIDNVLTHPSK